MKLIILLFKPHRAWLSRCLSFFLLLSGLLVAGQVRGQLYTGGYGATTVSPFYYYDLTTNTWTAKTSSPVNALWSLTAFQGKVYGITSGKVYIYDPATNAWTTVTNASFPFNIYIETVGSYIYASRRTGTIFQRYDPVTNTATTLAPLPSGATGNLTYDGGDYIYSGASSTASLIRYSISSDTWTTLPTPPHSTEGVAYKNGKLYLGSTGAQKLSAYDPATNTYTTLAAPPFKLQVFANGNGNYIYGGGGYGVARYDTSNDTWTALTGTSNIQLVYMGATCAPTASATATQATCASGGGVNANAALTLSAYGGGVTKVGYSAGSTYTGPAFSTATAVTTAPMTLANNLTNPLSVQPYTIRVFQDATCYQDVLVTLNPKVCLTSDLSLTVSPPTQSGAKGEQLAYTFTLTNAGPDTASNVTTRIPIPNNARLLSTTASQGSYSEGTAVWTVGTVAVGSQTITLTLQLK